MTKKTFYRILIKGIKYFTIIFTILFILFISSVFIFSKYYNKEIKEITLNQVNNKLNSPISFDNISLSIFSNFPLVSISIDNINILDPVNKRDTLLYSSKLDLSFSALDFFKKEYSVRELVAYDGFSKIHIYTNGEKNFLVFRNENENDNNQLRFVLEKLTFIDFSFLYKNDLLNQDYSFSVKNSSLRGNFTSDMYDLEINSNLNINHFRLDKINYINNKKAKISLIIKVQNNPYNLTIDKGELEIADMHFSVEGNYISSKSDYVDLILIGKKIQLSEVFSVFPINDLAILNRYNSSGELKFTASLKGELSPIKPLLFTSDFKAENASFEDKQNNINLSNIYLDGKFNNRNQVLEISDFSALMQDNEIKGKFKLIDFHQPKLNIDLKGGLDLKNVNYWLSDFRSKFKGKIDFDVISEINLTQKTINKINGSILSDEVFLRDSILNLTANIKDAKIDLNNQEVTFLANQLLLEEDKCKLYFKLNNWMKLAFDDSKEIVGDFNFDFETFKLDNWLYYFTNNQDSSNSNFNVLLNGNLSAGLFHYDSLIFTDLDLNKISVSDKLKIESIKMKGQGGDYDLNINSSNLDLINPYLDIKGDIKGIKLNEFFAEFKNFNQSLIKDKHLSGKWSSNFSARFFYNSKEPIGLKNIQLLSINNFEKIQLIEYPFLEELLDYFESSIITRNIMDLDYYKRHIDKVVFEDFYSNVSITNGRVNVDRTTIKNDLLNFNFHGYYDHSDSIDYHLNFNWKEIRKDKRDNIDDEELGKQLFLLIYGHINDLNYGLDKKEIKKVRKDKINQEKEIIKKIIKGEEIETENIVNPPVFEVEWEEEDSSENTIKPIDTPFVKEKIVNSKKDSSKLNKFLKKIGVEEQEKQKPIFEIDQ